MAGAPGFETGMPSSEGYLMFVEGVEADIESIGKLEN